MRFGLQKMTLLDYPGKVSCTVFTHGCNFRCPFCHNASLVNKGSEDGMMEQAELLEFLRRRTGILEGICITGGEPLLHPELFDFLIEIRSMGYPVKLDTNGSFPDKLAHAVENGLVNYVAMDIKHTQEKYVQAIGVDKPEFIAAVRQSIDFLRRGDLPYEFRTTVVKGIHAVEDFAVIGQQLAGVPRYYLQKYTDSGDILGESSRLEAFSDEEMKQCLKQVLPYIPGAALRGVN